MTTFKAHIDGGGLVNSIGVIGNKKVEMAMNQVLEALDADEKVSLMGPRLFWV